MPRKPRKPKDIKINYHDVHMSKYLDIEQAYVIRGYLDAKECEDLGKWLIKAAKYLKGRAK